MPNNQRQQSPFSTDLNLIFIDSTSTIKITIKKILLTVFLYTFFSANPA